MSHYTQPPGASKVYGLRLTGSGWGADTFLDDVEQTKWSISPSATLSDRVVDGKLCTVRVTGLTLGKVYELKLEYMTAGGHGSSRIITIRCDWVKV